MTTELRTRFEESHPCQDPTVKLLPSLHSFTNGTTVHLQRMRALTVETDGFVPAKYKALTAMLWCIAAREETGARHYRDLAGRLGASDAELSEFLAISAVMGGSAAEWLAAAMLPQR